MLSYPQQREGFAYENVFDQLRLPRSRPVRRILLATVVLALLFQIYTQLLPFHPRVSRIDSPRSRVNRN